MSSIRRPGASIDTLRLGRAVSYPGIDPRLWCSLAIVSKVNVDVDHGPFVDVTLLPSGMTATARVGAEMAGGGFGIWAPILVDDEVVVVAPDGAPANGLVVVRRLWSAADKPPDDAVQHPGDVLVQAKPGTNVRIRATGDGTQALVAAPDIVLQASPATTIEVKSDGSITLTGTQVLLGGADASERALLTEEFLTALELVITNVASAFDALLGQAGSAPIGAGGHATMTSALAAFHNAADSYKSQIVKVK